MNYQKKLKFLKEAGINPDWIDVKKLKLTDNTEYCLGVLKGRKKLKGLSTDEQVYFRYLQKRFQNIQKLECVGKNIQSLGICKSLEEFLKEYKKMSWIQKIFFKYF